MIKKHFIGFLLFSLIVTAAGFFGLRKIETFETPLVSTGDSCLTFRQDSSEKGKSLVKQAFLNLKTKELKIDVNFPQNNAPIALHFYAKDYAGTRFLETVILPENSMRAGKNQKLCDLDFLFDGLSKKQNLYIFAETFSSSANGAKNAAPAYDEKAAVPVSIYSGKKAV